MAEEGQPVATEEGGADPGQEGPKHEGFFGSPKVVIESTDGKTAEAGGAAPTPGQKQEAGKEGAGKEGAQPPVETPPADVYKVFTDVYGTEIKSDEDLLNALKSSRDLGNKLTEQQKRLQELDSLDPLAKDFDRAIKSGMDINRYWEARGMEPSKMDDKEALWKKFSLDNPKMDPVFARSKFEREFHNRFGLLTADLSAEETEQKKADIEYARNELKEEARLSRESLTDWKSKNVTIPEKRDPVVDEESVRKYHANSEVFVKNLNTIEIPIGEDKNFNLGVEHLAPQIKGQLENPIETLLELGVDIKAGTLDPAKFGEALVKLAALDEIGDKLAVWALEQKDAQTLKSTLKQPKPPKPLAGGGAAPERSHDEKVGEAFQAWHAARRARG